MEYLCVNNILYFILYNTIYIAYIEKNVGGILFRPDENNVKKINICSLTHFLVQPLNIKRPEVFEMFWTPNNWDMNYIVITCGAWGIKSLFDYTYTTIYSLF
jgi:hypothetical protein